MTSKEIDQATGALVNWFQSQGICPADGGLIMVRLQAAQFVLKSRDTDKLQTAIDLQKMLLTVEVAGFLAAVECGRMK